MYLEIPTLKVYEPLLQPSRYKGIYGGRAKGASHHFAGDLIDRCVQEKTDWVCLREVQRTLDQSVKKVLVEKIREYKVGAWFDIQLNKIKTPYGGVILFMGMQDHTAASIKSLEGMDGAWFEEAQTASQYSLDLLIPTIRKEGSEMWFNWNPESESDPIDVFLRQNQPPNSIVVRASYKDNPMLPKVLIPEIEWMKQRDYQKYLHIWEGEYNTNADALIFKNWRVEEFEANEEDIFRFGADWGFSIDPSVLIRCFVRGRTLYVDYEAFLVGCEIENLPSLFLTVPQSEKWPIIADSQRPDTIDYMKRNGFSRMMPAVKGQKSVEEGINFLQGFDIVVHPRCSHTIDELKHYKYKVDPLTGMVLPIIEDKNNHVIDSLRYACEGLRRVSEIKTSNVSLVTPGGNSWMSQ
jgi:phage terminase large subunit